MLIHLHKQATTTPKVRAAIQTSDEPLSTLAERFGTMEQTLYKWKHRDNVHDRSHTPHRMQATLTPVQEAVAVALRTTLLVSLDDLLAVLRKFLNPNVSRSGPLPGPRWGGKSPRSQVKDTKAETHHLHGLRARIHPFRREVPAVNG